MSISGRIQNRKEAIERAAQIIKTRTEKIEDILDALKGIQNLIDFQRERIAKLRKDTQDNKDLTDEQRHQRIEDLADQLDEERAHKDRLLERLDRLRSDRTDAREVIEKNKHRIEQLRARRRRMREDRAGQLTEHFHVAEFDCHDGTPVPKASYAALKDHCQRYLEPLRSAHGAVHINSGFRTLSYNASIGGATLSVHVYDGPWQHEPWACAVDHVADGASPSTVQTWHESHTHPDGLGRYSSFSHADNRGRLGWADARWNGP